MTEKELQEVEKYREYPEGSGGRKIYDSVYLSFGEYLKKYYSNPDLETWHIWQKKYLESAFDESRHKELVDRFGYISIDMHDFSAQYDVYNQLRTDNRLDEETRKFIGFMSGTGFFKKHSISVGQWFKMKNWSNPYRKDGERAFEEILKYPFGLNMLKTNLPHLDYWRR